MWPPAPLDKHLQPSLELVRSRVCVLILLGQCFVLWPRRVRYGGGWRRWDQALEGVGFAVIQGSWYGSRQ